MLNMIFCDICRKIGTIRKIVTHYLQIMGVVGKRNNPPKTMHRFGLSNRRRNWGIDGCSAKSIIY